MAETIDPFPRYTREPGVLLSYGWSTDITKTNVPQSVTDLRENDSIKVQLNYENYHEFAWVEVLGYDKAFGYGKLVETPYTIPLEKGDVIHFKTEHVFQWLWDCDCPCHDSQNLSSHTPSDCVCRKGDVV